MTAFSDDAIIKVRDLTVGFNGKLILEHLDLDVKRGEILGFVGASGSGKSVLTRTIIGLLRKINGSIAVFGVDMDVADDGAGQNRFARTGSPNKAENLTTFYIEVEVLEDELSIEPNRQVAHLDNCIV